MRPRKPPVLNGCVLSLVLAFGFTALADVKPASNAAAAKAAADAAHAADAVVKNAVADLLKEADAAAKDPKALRMKSDYFQQNKTPGVTPTAIAAALNRSLGRDAASDAYIKWQLCSALHGLVLDAKQDPRLVKAMLSAYDNAPAPSPRPGLDPNAKREMDRLVTAAKPAQLDALNEAFAATVAQWNTVNEPVLNYRDGLYGIVSQLPEAIPSSLGDGYLRASRGVSSDKLMMNVMDQIQAWAATAPQQQVLAVANKIKQMAKDMNGLPANADAGFHPAARFAELLKVDGQSDLQRVGYPAKAGPAAPAKASFPPWFYTTCAEDPKSHHNGWAEAQAGFVKPADMAAMYKSLIDIAKNSGNGGAGGGGLQFKDSTKS